MSYWTVESNSLTDEKFPKNGKLEVHVNNDSATPARDDGVVIRPLSHTPNITCDEGYRLQDGPGGMVLVTLGRIPAKSTAKVVLVDVVDKYPNAITCLEDRITHIADKSSACKLNLEIYKNATVIADNTFRIYQTTRAPQRKTSHVYSVA
jgi:hypothetical protein